MSKRHRLKFSQKKKKKKKKKKKEMLENIVN